MEKKAEKKETEGLFYTSSKKNDIFLEELAEAFNPGKKKKGKTKTEAQQIFKRIDKAEEESFHICERCGNPGELDTTKMWYRTLCMKCKENRK